MDFKELENLSEVELLDRYAEVVELSYSCFYCRCSNGTNVSYGCTDKSNTGSSYSQCTYQASYWCNTFGYTYCGRGVPSGFVVYECG